MSSEESYTLSLSVLVNHFKGSIETQVRFIFMIVYD